MHRTSYSWWSLIVIFYSAPSVGTKD